MTRTKLSRIMTGVLAGFFLCTATSMSSPRSLTLSDLRREVTLADPQISPDGSRIVMIVSRADFSNDTQPDTVVMVDTESGHATRLAIAQTKVSSLRWSPNGKLIAYLAASGDNPRQLYISSSRGTNIRKLTDAKNGVVSYAWRPDGRALGYVTQDVAAPAKGPARFNKSFVVGDNDYLTTSKPQPAHIWSVAASGGRPEQLTTGSAIVPFGGLIEPQHFPNQFFCWVNGGRALVYTRAPDAYEAHWNHAVLHELDLQTKRDAKLTSHTGLEAGCDTSPDGKRFNYWYPHAGQPISASVIYVRDTVTAGDGKAVTENLDRSPWLVHWMPDSRSLLILAHDHTSEGMWVVDLNGAVHRVNVGNRCVSAASVSKRGAIAFLSSGPRTPTELYVMRSPNGVPHQITHINVFFGSLHLGAVSHIEWHNEGFDESGVLTYPPNFVAGKKYPLVLQIHGWPQYASQEAFDTDYPGLSQLLAAHGYVVFEPNYRGSDNMGAAFESAIAGDSSAGPGRDIMSGIDAVKRLGFVDETRIGVSGWSYGGQLTAWLIGQHDFRAAMAGAAPTDQTIDYAIGEYNVLGTLFVGPSPWSSKTDYARWAEQSPITYAWNVKTPTLFMSDIFDVTVPVTHAYELYHALRDRGVPTEFVAYPVGPHYPPDPVQSEDVYRRWVGWFDRYMR